MTAEKGRRKPAAKDKAKSTAKSVAAKERAKARRDDPARKARAALLRANANVERMQGGRKPLYDPRFNPMIREMVNRGAKRSHIAELLGVTPQTIGNWMSIHPEFNEVMRITNLDAHAEVVKRAAFEMATGYDYLGEEIFCHKGVITRVPVMKHIPPNIQAVTKTMRWLAPNDPAFCDDAKVTVSATESFVDLWKLVSNGGLEVAQQIEASKASETSETSEENDGQST